ncbi:MAG: right-handed parallel beta-helix repeat-containing protein [Sedimentisphaerales bacterium]|nr:right-handed parallel beta-helix repeat-containing protein [Sedimentisphaerales bacterium]
MLRQVCVFVVVSQIALIASTAAGRDAAYNVLDFGAAGDLRSLDTQAIQNAIDACHEEGGGTVVFPAGKEFLTGTLVLKSNVTLEIPETAMLRGSRELSHYIKTVPNLESYAVVNYSDYALIQAVNAENIGIRGKGVIDGDGVAVPGRTGYGHLKTRPYILRFIRCKNVEVRDVMLKNTNFWTHHYLECDNVHVDGVRVRAMNLDPHQPNGDGIDIDGCQHVIVENMDIQSEDDGITLKSTSMRPTRDVLIRDCTVQSNCNAIKFGTETHSVIEDVVVRNCRVIFGGRSALAVMSADGAHVQNILFENIVIDETAVPIFVRLADRMRTFELYENAVMTFNDEEKVRAETDREIGIVRNITFRNIVSHGVRASLPPKTMPRSVGSAFSGVNGHMIENLVLENLDLTYAGGIRDRDKTYAGVPERPAHYPTPEIFGELPAFAFYFRHVNGVVMKNVTIRTLEPDLRSSLVFDNAHDVRIEDVIVPRTEGAAPAAEFFHGSDGSHLTATSAENHDLYQLAGSIPPAD